MSTHNTDITTAFGTTSGAFSGETVLTMNFALLKAELRSMGTDLDDLMGRVAFFDTITAAAAATIDTTVNAVIVCGNTAIGDMAPTLYDLQGSTPSHNGYFTSNGGSKIWVYIPGPEGVDVRVFGATGNGTTDDSTAIANAWVYGWANPAASDGYGVTLFFPAGEYLITTNDVFGSPGVTGQKRYGHIVGPASGKGSAKITFKPTTGNSTFSDNKYYLFDGGAGDGVSFNAFHPQYFSIRNLHIVLDKTNLTTGDEIWVWRADGESASFNIEFHDVRVTGPGSKLTGVNAKSGVIELVGDTNVDSCAFNDCFFTGTSHVLRSSNPQAVSTSFNRVGAWMIWEDFFDINDGALTIQINGGSFLWNDTPDVSPQYLFNLTSSGSGIGTSNHRIVVNAMKPEMRASGSRLVKATDTAGTIVVSFTGINFAGGGISGDRDVTTLHTDKTVIFRDCTIPDAFSHDFQVTDGSRGGVNWAVSNLGLVIYEGCRIRGDLSSKITKVGDGGRVIAKDCYGWANDASPYDQIAVDFDSNPFVTGHKEPQPWLKTVKLVDNSAIWNGDDAFIAFLPYNAIIHRVQAIRYAGTGVTSRTLNITDGDAVTLATDTSDEATGFDASADISLADNTGLAQKRTTTNKRTITAQITTTLTGNTASGIGYIQYW